MITLYNRLLEATGDKPKNIFLPPTEADLANRVKQYIAIIANKLKKQGVLNADGSYDFKDDVDISHLGLKNITELGIKFGKVRGFYCSYNKLTSLEGAPSKVGSGFYCSHNQLTSLKGAPTKVGGSFNCSSNKLTNLEGAPTKVGGYFYCHGNKVKFSKDDVRKVSKVKGEIIT